MNADYPQQLQPSAPLYQIGAVLGQHLRHIYDNA
jgi:hypothetical protein